MNILFIGTSEFAVVPLEFLINKKYNISGVITQPDKPAGRGKKLISSPVKQLSLKKNLTILQPENINIPEIEKFIKEKKIDLGIVISYGQIINKNIFSLPKYKIINLHPSLLPKYRGPSPIQSVLLNGEEKTGNSIIEITEKMDAGPILIQEEIAINKNDDYYSLHNKLSIHGANLIVKVIEKLKNQEDIKKIPQNEIEATYCNLINKDCALINWNNNSYTIFNQIRALCKWPIAYTYLNGKILKIYKAELYPNNKDYKNLLPGTIVKFSKKSFGVVCGDKKILKIVQLQIQGKKVLNTQDFLNGVKITTGDKLGID